MRRSSVYREAAAHTHRAKPIILRSTQTCRARTKMAGTCVSAASARSDDALSSRCMLHIAQCIAAAAVSRKLPAKCRHVSTFVRCTCMLYVRTCAQCKQRIGDTPRARVQTGEANLLVMLELPRGTRQPCSVHPRLGRPPAGAPPASTGSRLLATPSQRGAPLRPLPVTVAAAWGVHTGCNLNITQRQGRRAAGGCSASGGFRLEVCSRY